MRKLRLLLRTDGTRCLTMTSPDRSSPTSDAFASCDGDYLRALREAADMDVLVLARKACLSVGQVRELESGETGRYFYSETIKRHAYKRVLMVLGVTPPPDEAAEVASPVIAPDDRRLEPLDLIVAMSHRPALDRPILNRIHTLVDHLQQHKQTLGALLLLLLALAGLLTYGTQRATTGKPTAKEVATAVAAPVTTTLALEAPSNADTACAFSTADMPQLAPLQAHKEGRYVHLVSTSPTQVCMVDSQKRATLLHMKAGENQSVYGAAPWQISGPNLREIKIYFQGGLVALPDGAIQRLSLVEASVTR